MRVHMCVHADLSRGVCVLIMSAEVGVSRRRFERFEMQLWADQLAAAKDEAHPTEESGYLSIMNSDGVLFIILVA